MNPTIYGGPAFPLPFAFKPSGEVAIAREYYEEADGMFLRDYFAGQALAGMMANSGIVDNFNSHSVMAAESYNLADAMLAARAGKEGA